MKKWKDIIRPGKNPEWEEIGEGTNWEEDKVQEGQKEKKLASKRFRNKEFARVTWFFVILFVFMMGYLIYFNVVEANDILASPHNQRANLFADRIIRGPIVDRNGNILAETRMGENGIEYRAYPFGSAFGHVIGYESRTVGRVGLELAENSSLLTSNAFILDQFMNELSGERNQGDTVVTTLNADLQMAAYNALGNNNGAIVVLEASTGNILAMVAKPGFDPNIIDETWQDLNADERNSPLLNRATQGLYAPGSVFKIVTSLAYIRQNPDFQNYNFDCSGTFTMDGVTIQCIGGRAHGFQDLRLAFALSCNCAYADLGLIVEPHLLRQTAEHLMFNQPLPAVMDTSSGFFTVDEDSTISERMITAFGQGNTMVSPYHMALITAAIANGGVLMEPYLVYAVESNTGGTVRRNVPRSYRTLMSPQEAAVLKDHMVAVVTEGTAMELSGQSFTAAGKTGTAEFGVVEDGMFHSWFVGFTNVDNPELVISVVIEGLDGTDGARAVPLALQVLRAYYN